MDVQSPENGSWSGTYSLEDWLPRNDLEYVRSSEHCNGRLQIMRWICMAVLLLPGLGCGSKPNLLPDAVPCKFTLLAIDGTPLGDQIRVADRDGLVGVFVEIDVASVSLDHFDLAGRPIHEPNCWELDLCIVDRNSDKDKLRPVASLIYDDPAIRTMYPETLSDLIPQSARPESFSSEKYGVIRYFGSVNVRGIHRITGPHEFALRLFPTADKNMAIPVTRLMGVPVPLHYFHAEFQE